MAHNDSTFFTIVSDPSSQHDDSIYASNNYCANWSYGSYAIPKSKEGSGKMMNKVGSKVWFFGIISGIGLKVLTAGAVKP